MTDDETDEQSTADDVKQRLSEAGERAAQYTRTAAADAKVLTQEVAAEVQQRNEEIDWRAVGERWLPVAAKGLVTVVSLLGVYWILQAMWAGFGPISTIAYVVLFIMGAVGTPLLVILFAPSFPGILRELFGKLHWFLGAVTYGNTILVQSENGWKARPARNGEVWLDGEWHDIEGGFEHKSTILGLPFAIAPDKTSEDAYSSVRVDPHAEGVTDGGVVTSPSNGNRERGGLPEVNPDASVSGMDGVWLADLVRIMSTGLERAGNGELIEQAEMDTLQKEAKRDRLQGWKPVVGMVLGLILGGATGFVMIGFM